MNRDELERARTMWRYRGTERPSFAVAPGPGQESVWDYPRPPRIDSDTQPVRVLFGDTVIAQSVSAVRVLETASPPVYYLPPADVRTDLLRSEHAGSICEWKGSATYWSLCAGDTVLANVGWSYEEPLEAFAPIRGYVSFYPAKLQCHVGAHRVAPQPGGFYGGWVTPDIVGPFKGAPGTGAW